MVEDLYDLIETSTLENEYHSGLRPVIPWDKPTEEELTAWMKAKSDKAPSVLDSVQFNTDTTEPFSMEWFFQQEVGLFLFSAFCKETKKDYPRMNFCEEVYRYRRSARRVRIWRSKVIVKEFLTAPVRHAETNAAIIPPFHDKMEYRTEIDEHDLTRINPPNQVLSTAELESALKNNMDHPVCSESIVGLKGSYLQETVKRVFEFQNEINKETPAAAAGESTSKNGNKLLVSHTSDEIIPGNTVPSIDRTMFDVLERIVFESLRREYWQLFLESSHYKRLLNFLWYQDRRVVPEDFFPMRVLGRGGFGLVKACKKGTSGKLYAMKIMNKKRIKMKQSEQLAINERKALAAVQSNFIVNLKYSFHSKDDVFLILEMMTGGDLGYHLHRVGCFQKNECQFYAARIMLGLQALHDKRYVYRDLKPENCLLADDGRVKITDLGLATRITPKLHGAAGTRGYWAPEMLRRDANGKSMVYGHAVDWFSFGVCLAEFICGRNPFRSEEAKRFGMEHGMQTKEKQYDHATLELDPSFPPEQFEPEAADLCRKLLDKNEKTRLGYNGCKEIMVHPWFDGVRWEHIIADTERPPFLPPKEVNAMSQPEIGTFGEDKAYQETVITSEDEALYAGWDWTNPRAFAAEVIEFLVHERKEGMQLIPLTQQPSCCCVVL